MPQNMCSPCKSLFKLPKETCQILKGKPKRSKLFFLLGVRSRCLWLSGETELKSYNCTFSRARSAIQPTHILAQEESEQGLPLAGTNLTTPLTTVQFSGACSSLSAHSLVHQSVGKTGLTRVAFTGNTRSLVWPGSIKACSLMPNAQLPLVHCSLHL